MSEELHHHHHHHHHSSSSSSSRSIKANENQTRLENEKKKKSLFIILGTGVLVAILLFLFLDPIIDSSHTDNSDYQSYINAIDGVQYINNRKYKVKNNLQTYCLIGVDKDGSINTYTEGSENADYVSYIAIDNTKKTYTILQVNRDTMVTYNVLGIAGEVVGTAEGQIAISHNYGNDAASRNYNTINALKKLFKNKLPVDEYMGFTMTALERFNDIVAPAGISVTITADMYDDALADLEYSIGQTVALNGIKAKQFLRARTDTIDGNVKRMARHNAYMEAFKTKAHDVSLTWSTLTSGVADYIDYNIDVENVDSILTKLKTYNSRGIVKLDGELSTVQGSTGTNVAFTPSVESINNFLTTYIYDPFVE